MDEHVAPRSVAAVNIRVAMDEEDCVGRLAEGLAYLVELFPLDARERLLFLCIGTDRSTGDALGPLVGTFLHQHGLPAERVLGTLDEPVHAANLREHLRDPRLRGRHYAVGAPLVIAVDACLGRPENVGTINVGLGSLRPGSGVRKELPAVGDIYITGTVNVGGFMDFFVLQNTRLAVVMKMASTIAQALALLVRERLKLPTRPPTRTGRGRATRQGLDRH